MKISIVMAYHNRPRQLYTTLKSIEQSKSAKEAEIIIIDDASDFKPIKLGEFDLNIRLFRVDEENKWWKNPCIPFNLGFRESSGEYVILQNPECIHVGDVITYVKENAERDTYLSFHCYSIGVEITHRLWKNLDYIKDIEFFEGQPNSDHPDDGWYNHEIYRPSAYNFCNAISKYRLDELGGFDERFASATGKDDVQFAYAIEHHKKMNTKFVADPFVIHQYHKRYWTGGAHENIRLFKEIQRETIRKELIEEYLEEYNVKSFEELGWKTKCEFEGEYKRREAFVK